MSREMRGHMLVTCYACKQSFELTNWNAARFMATCPTPSCGRQVHVGEAAQRAYGEKVGGAVKQQLAVLTDLKGRGDHTHIIEHVTRRVEKIMVASETEARQLAMHEKLIRFLAGANRLVKGNAIKQPTGPRPMEPVDICLVADKLARYLRKEKRVR